MSSSIEGGSGMKERRTAERDTTRPADLPPRCKHCAEPIVGYWSSKPGFPIRYKHDRVRARYGSGGAA
jgi:hypothetical protein